MLVLTNNDSASLGLVTEKKQTMTLLVSFRNANNTPSCSVSNDMDYYVKHVAVQIFSVVALIYCPVKRFYVSVASQNAGCDASFL